MCVVDLKAVSETRKDTILLNCMYSMNVKVMGESEVGETRGREMRSRSIKVETLLLMWSV